MRLELDCAGECGGTAEIDECGVCGGPGATLECGCTDIPEGDCDLDGNQLDACGCAADQATSTLVVVLTNLKAIAIATATRKMPWAFVGEIVLSDNNENGICDTEEFGCSDPEACNFVSADLMDDGFVRIP